MRKVVAAAVGLLVVLAVAGFWVSRSSLFHARHVLVTGNAHLSQAQVERIAGVGGTTNVAWMDAGEAAVRLLRNPWIERASVRTSLPWTVSISITERTPVAVEGSGASSTLVAGDGTALGRAGADIHLPSVSAGAGSIADATKALEAFPPDLLSKVRSATGGADSTVNMVLSDGTKVAFGTTDQAAAKAQSLSTVLAWATAHHRGLVSIDVSAPDAPTARLKGGASVSA